MLFIKTVAFYLFYTMPAFDDDAPIDGFITTLLFYCKYSSIYL